MARIPLTYALIVEQFCKLVYPAIVAAGTLLVLNRHSVVSVPGWLIGVLSAGCIVPFHIGMARLRLLADERKAATLGAILPPRYPGKAIGNWDVLGLLDDAYFNGYLSEIKILLSLGVLFR